MALVRFSPDRFGRAMDCHLALGLYWAVAVGGKRRRMPHNVVLVSENHAPTRS